MQRTTVWVMGVATALAAALGASARGGGGQDVAPATAVNVEGHEPVKPGEHPRLIYRKSDIAELRRRAQTPEGKAILTRCEKMSETFTTWSAAACAFLYLATGDDAWAARAKEEAQAMMDGKGNREDGRYHYSKPGGPLRSGPVIAAMGLAYDMAYDGWSPEFRKRVAESIINHPMGGIDTYGPHFHPSCNHFGPHCGGVGVGAMAVRGDPEVAAQSDRVEAWFMRALKDVERELSIGFSDRGFYYEGHYCGRMSGNTGVIPFMLAYRTACGVDLRKVHEGAQWITAKWIYELVRMRRPLTHVELERGKASEPREMQVRSIQRGMYQRDPFTRGIMLSSDGDFAMGFGLVDRRYRRALWWTYRNLVEPEGTSQTYDIWEYPHFAAYSMKYWPIGEEPQNPSEVLPRILHDKEPGCFIFRNGWAGPDRDLLVSVLLGIDGVGRGCSVSGSVWILGRGVRYEFPGAYHLATPSVVELDPATASGIITATPRPIDPKRSTIGKLIAAEPTSLAVDFSGRSGYELMVIMTGPMAGLVSIDCRNGKRQSEWDASGGWHCIRSIHDPKNPDPKPLPDPFKPMATKGAPAAPAAPSLDDMDMFDAAPATPSKPKQVDIIPLRAPPPLKTWVVRTGGRNYYLTVFGETGKGRPAIRGNRVGIGKATVSYDAGAKKLVLSYAD